MSFCAFLVRNRRNSRPQHVSCLILSFCPKDVWATYCVCLYHPAQINLYLIKFVDKSFSSTVSWFTHLTRKCYSPSSQGRKGINLSIIHGMTVIICTYVSSGRSWCFTTSRGRVLAAVPGVRRLALLAGQTPAVVRSCSEGGATWRSWKPLVSCVIQEMKSSRIARGAGAEPEQSGSRAGAERAAWTGDSPLRFCPSRCL